MPVRPPFTDAKYLDNNPQRSKSVPDEYKRQKISKTSLGEEESRDPQPQARQRAHPQVQSPSFHCPTLAPALLCPPEQQGQVHMP